MLLVDSNVLLVVLSAGPTWLECNAANLQEALDADPVLINVIVYGDIAFAVQRTKALEELMPPDLDLHRAIPEEASFLAAGAHAADRERGGLRQTILPDFPIGAHALVEGIPLLTRDQRRYRQAFPGLKLISTPR
ncbi:type II toxin-antitoxin system VapC family toxin [Cyanobium sp. Morenito 9A2]|uniref:type II toxin-antitoxin system VapC family toxin n=1 Tax=Cyanobium sp. Morenito 9A2 TaxID=2823718 RepID=UPI0020CE64C6|nr:type II toxin-antitoxin system VapC family toxin [Cyanobium sp. Morenito 9A2]MCP9849787.1 type II toxin-antitoxin system VapC family toxin [Cyanobium sp. Morenito 9A2]